MNTTIRIFIVTVFALGFGSFANAQSASISANATVISEIVVQSVDNLDFGTLVAGQIKTIYGAGEVEVSVGPNLGSSNMGQFTVSAQPGSDVSLGFTMPSSLTGPNESTLPFDSAVSSDLVNVFISAGEIAKFWNTSYGEYNFNNQELNGFPEFQAIPGINSIQVFIGGRVNATSAAAGTYTGTIILTATYN